MRLDPCAGIATGGFEIRIHLAFERDLFIAFVRRLRSFGRGLFFGVDRTVVDFGFFFAGEFCFLFGLGFLDVFLCFWTEFGVMFELVA